MDKRIFAERDFLLQGKVLPIERFRLFADLENGFDIPKFRCVELIGKAEIALDQQIPQLSAEDYMLFCKTGNRSILKISTFCGARCCLT